MAYPSDVTDKQWGLIKGYFKYGNYGNRSRYEKRELVNAIFYLTKTGCQWRQLPNNFPPWKTFYSFFKRAKDTGIWEKIMDSLVKKSHVAMGKQPKPSYSLIDSQSVKMTSAAKERGIDGGKKVKGQKRHIVTDTQGHVLQVTVHAANRHDTVAGYEVFEKALQKYPSLQGVCADAGYRKTMEMFVINVLKRTIEISQRIAKKWVLLPKRWVVERTFSWFNYFRRLSKDYEITTSSAENYVFISHSITLLQRLQKT